MYSLEESSVLMPNAKKMRCRPEIPEMELLMLMLMAVGVCGRIQYATPTPGPSLATGQARPGQVGMGIPRCPDLELLTSTTLPLCQGWSVSGGAGEAATHAPVMF